MEAQEGRFLMDRVDFFRLKLTSCVAKYDDGGHVGDIFHLIFTLFWGRCRENKNASAGDLAETGG